MRRYFYLALIASLAVSVETFAQDLPAWRLQGWCDYRWPFNQDPPPRLNLPDWVCETAYDAKLHAKYTVYSKINPFFMTADFNGDGQLDAAVWVSDRRTKKRGLIVFHRTEKRPIVLAAGTKWEERGDDFSFLDQWSLMSRGELLSSVYEEGRKVMLETDALVLIKPESAAFAVYWDGKTYKSYQLSD